MNKCFFILIFSLFLFLESDAQYVAGQSYFGANNYIEYIPGDLPIIIVAPHGGSLTPGSLPVISTHGIDNGTFETTHFLKDSIIAQTGGCMPHVIINHLHPTIMKATDEIDTAAGINLDSRQAWTDFHDFIDDAKLEVTNTWGAGHYFEMHGNGHSEMWTEIGLGVSPTYLNGTDSVILTRVGYSTVKNLCTIGGANFLGVIKGQNSIGGLLDAKGWKSVPSPSYPAPGTGGFFYAGWNTWLHGSRYSGTIDASHVENYYAFMQTANRAQYSSDLAESMLIFMQTHYGFTWNCSVGIEMKNNNIKTNIHPNPSSSQLIIDTDISINKITIVDITGKAIKTYTPNTNTINISNLPNGIYFIKIFGEENTVTQKFVKH